MKKKVPVKNRTVTTRDFKAAVYHLLHYAEDYVATGTGTGTGNPNYDRSVLKKKCHQVKIMLEVFK